MVDFVTISLKDLRFHAFHGLYKEERSSGNDFIINLSVCFRPASGIITGISDTVNYASLYDLLKGEMQKPRDLLETFVMETVEKIHITYPMIKKIDITISKLHPPMVGFEGAVDVRYTKDFT